MINLNTEKLYVGYENKIVVNDININLMKGESLCFLGPNGAGKTTILRTISKLLNPVKGTVYIDGKNIFEIPARDMSKKMSVVLTNKFSGGLMTVLDVVAMGRYPYTGFFGYIGKNDIEKINDSLKIVNADKISESYFDELSDGQKQKVLVARALVQEPEIILLDEPTSHLDIKHRLELVDILRKLTKEKQITVILSLHEIDMALKSFDKVALVNNGNVVAYGAPEDFVNEDIIEKLYGIKEANFNYLLGTVELSNNNESKAFVLGGSGSGTPVYRVLTKYNIGFSTGILHENDIDYEIARTMGLNILKEKPFEKIKDENINKAKKIIKNVPIVIDAAFPAGDINRSNVELIEFALGEGKKVLSLRKKDEFIRLIGSDRGKIEYIDCMELLLDKILAI